MMLKSEELLLEIEETGRGDVVTGILSGGTHLAVWCAIIAVLDETSPDWNRDGSKCAARNAVEAIRKLAKR